MDMINPLDDLSFNSGSLCFVVSERVFVPAVSILALYASMMHIRSLHTHSISIKYTSKLIGISTLYASLMQCYDGNLAMLQNAV